MLPGSGVAASEGVLGAAISAVRTADGTRVECDFAVVGVGVMARDEIAERSEIETADGIPVDEYLRTSAPDVFAADDVACAYHPRFRRSVRVEHCANAPNQGPAAARNMPGVDEPYERFPYFFSDHYDVGMEYAGHAAEWDDVVVRGDLAGHEFIAFWLREGRVIAGMSVNVWDVSTDIQALIRAGAVVERKRLADPTVALADLLPAGREA